MSGIQQHIQSVSVAYSVQSLTSPLSASAGQQLSVNEVNLYNASASPNILGIFHSVSDPQFKMYQLLSGGDLNVTSSIQSGVTISLFNTVNNDGVLFQAKDKFQLITFNVVQAQAGSPVYTYKYWNGSTFSTLTLLNTPSYATTGIKVIAFNAPIDWVTGDGTEDGDSEMYSIQVTATTAPSQIVTINSLKIGKMLKYSDSVPQYATVNVNFEDEPYLLQSGEAIIPFFSYTDPSNRIEIAYKTT